MCRRSLVYSADETESSRFDCTVVVFNAMILVMLDVLRN